MCQYPSGSYEREALRKTPFLESEELSGVMVQGGTSSLILGPSEWQAQQLQQMTKAGIWNPYEVFATKPEIGPFCSTENTNIIRVLGERLGSWAV